MTRMTRRGLLTSAAAMTALGGCSMLGGNPQVMSFLSWGEILSMRLQRAMIGDRLVREYDISQISANFKANGSTMPGSAEYRALMEGDFANWRLVVDGMVTAPMSLSLADLRAMPARSQITRHDCVEGWSAIGQWAGVPLAAVLDRAGVASGARYVVFHCADELERTLDGSGIYYESIDMVDARHPQTILAYEMNGQTLPVPHGAPLRLRVERHLGYKHAKYLMRIELTDRLDNIWGGKGGFWEDRGYEWYAGI